MKKLSLLLVIILNFVFVDLMCNKLEDEIQVKVNDNAYPGYLLFDWQLNQDFGVIDNLGNLVQERNNKPGRHYFFKLKNGNYAQLADNHYNIYNSNMEWIDSIPNPTDYEIDFHDFISLSNGRYLMLLNHFVEKDLSQIVQGGQVNAFINDNVIIETDRTGQIYWQWRSLDHLNILDVTPDIHLTMHNIDFAHINSMDEDPNGNILISIRHYDEVALINKSTGNFIWRMGGSNCKNNQFTFTNDNMSNYVGFSHQHTAQFLDNGNLLIFDNGNLKTPPLSRVVEYNINTTAKTVTKVWEFQNSPPTFNYFMGSAQRLPNGNTLISWSNSIINEVRPDKSIAFQLSLTPIYNVYRAQKVDIGLKHGSQKIMNNGNYVFSGPNGFTDCAITVSSISGTTTCYVQKHDYPAFSPKFSDSLASKVLPMRWVFTPDKNGTSIAGTIKLSTNNLPAVYNPNKLVIFKRSKEGDGTFVELQTTYNPALKELSAPFSEWGEFVLVSAELDNPKGISPINNQIVQDEGQLKWSKVGGATNYFVQISKNQAFTDNKVNTSVNTNQYNFNSLEFNTNYYWRIKASNYKDTSDWSEIYTFKTSIKYPELIKPTNNLIGFVLKDTLKWSSVSTNAIYQLNVSTYDSFSNLIINENNLKNNSFVAKNLINNTLYYWKVRAISGKDTSKWSPTYNFITILADPTTSSPANNSINLEGNVDFDWSIVPGAEHYIFQLSLDKDFTQSELTLFDVVDNHINVTDLKMGKKYFWRVKAYRTTDTSNWSPISEFSTLLESVQLLVPANNLTNVKVDAVLSWQNHLEEVLYNIQLARDYNFTQIIIDSMNITKNLYQIIELNPNSYFYWRVKASKDEFVSNWSDVFMFKTGKGLELKAPSLLLPKNGDNILKDLSLHWAKRLKAVKYHLQISKFSQFDQIIKDTIVAKDHISFTNFDEGITYFWRIKALSIYDSSDWSPTWKFNVIAGVKSVELLKPGNDDLHIPINGELVWSELVDIDYYTVQLSEDENFTKLIIFEDINQYSIEFSNLKENTTYYWRVRFSENGVISDWTDTWSFTTTTNEVLNTPILTNFSDGMKTVPINGTLTWNEVPKANNYNISFSNSSNFSSISFKQSGIKGTSLNYKDLEYGTSYYVRISAFNDSATSYWSEPISFITELEPPQILFPTNNEENVPNIGSIVINSNQIFATFRIQIAYDDSFEDIYLDEDNIDYYVVPYQLESNTRYFCRVMSYNDTNYSRWSDVISFKTQNPASIDDSYELISNAITLFPNPSNDYINIELIGLTSYDEVSIFDLKGQIISKNDISKTKVIDISKLTSGAYILKIGIHQQIFIKQ